MNSRSATWPVENTTYDLRLPIAMPTLANSDYYYIEIHETRRQYKTAHCLNRRWLGLFA